MANDIYDWSTTAADNDDADSTINWLEGQLPGTVNGSARAMMKRLKELLVDLGGTGTVGGTANAITLTSAIASLVTGKVVTFVPTLTNTSVTVTLAVNALTAKNVRKIDNSGNEVALIPGDIVKGMRARVSYDSTANSAAGAWILHNPAQEARYPPGTLYGLTLSNNSGTPLTKIDIAAGSCRDGADSANMDLLSAITAKDGTAAWAPGSSAGCLDTGSIANNTWYHGWLIGRPDTGVKDFLISTSATAPTMPTNYTLKRRIGSPFRTNGSGQFAAFTQDGDTFKFVTTVTDRSSTSAVASGNLTLTVPLGIKTRPILEVQITCTTTIDASVQMGDGDASATTNPIAFIYNTSTGASAIGMVQGAYLTNTSSQLKFAVVINGGTLNGTNGVVTLGWIDTRGRS